MVFCDYHHGELYESLLKLFEDRLGGNVYRAIGKDWHTEGWWVGGQEPNLVEQYLGHQFSIETGGGFWINDVLVEEWKPHIKSAYDRTPHKQVSLERAKNTKWDFIVSTLPANFFKMEEFRLKYCPSAKHIFQIGNVLTDLPAGVVNVLNSTGVPFPQAKHYVEYHQEFNTQPLVWNAPSQKAISTFLISNITQKGKDFMALEKEMPDWVFKEYGVFNRDGHITGFKNEAAKIIEMSLLWHVKRNGDGYGYTLHKSLFAGKPVILNYTTVYRTHRLAKCGFLEEGKTFIEYDGKTMPELAVAINRFYENWEENSRYTYRRIREFINFDAEFAKVKKFLEDAI